MTSPLPDYREIILTQGQVARVSPHRFDHLNQFNWYAMWMRTNGKYYAVRKSSAKGGAKRHHIWMHREILGLAHDDEREGDHFNLDTLDNTDDNLRVATRTENQRNKTITRSNTSGHKGVSLRKYGRWRAHIRVNREGIYLGEYQNKQDALDIYAQAARYYHGNFARVQ